MLYYRKHEVPKHLQEWLYARGSLTQQLTELAQGKFSVQVLNSSYQRVSLADSLWLKVPYQHLAWVRESLLYGCEPKAWVKAKSIIPVLSLYRQARGFKLLKQRPMGKLLFQRTQPLCDRGVIYLAEGWTRQSCYVWHGCRLIVQETFLDDFEDFLLKY